MGYVWQRWLADELRAAGLEVIEVEGWENRGRPATTGNFDPRGPSTVHHDGATSSPSNPCPVLRILISGRPDLPGPLCQIAVDHLGRVFVIAAGRCNHAGEVGKSGVVGMPFGADGNALSIGDEVSTNGTQTLPEAQRHAIAVAHAVICDHFDVDQRYVHRHADISGTGKWDIGNRTTAQLRADVEEELNMPTPKEIANAVWDETVLVDGEQVRVGRLLVRIANQTAIGAKLKSMDSTIDKVLDEVQDDATQNAVRKLRADVAELRALAAVDDTTEEGTT